MARNTLLSGANFGLEYAPLFVSPQGKDPQDGGGDVRPQGHSLGEMVEAIDLSNEEGKGVVTVEASRLSGSGDGGLQLQSVQLFPVEEEGRKEVGVYVPVVPPASSPSIVEREPVVMSPSPPLVGVIPSSSEKIRPYSGIPEEKEAYVSPSHSHSGQSYPAYVPLLYYWFYGKEVEGRITWRPFSVMDSNNLEDAFCRRDTGLIMTDGGRYDVSVYLRQKYAVYWEESPVEVRRCSWYYKGPMDARFVPYDENMSERIEFEYLEGLRSNVWNRRIEFGDGESIIMYNANAVSHFCKAAAPDAWGNLPENEIRPRVVKRGVDESDIEVGESRQVDHLILFVHGIGSVCDFKFRTCVEVVDGFRSLAFSLTDSHFRDSVDAGTVGRCEFLPISWHKALHGDKGIDEKLKPITLKSIPKIRAFTNDTLLDILFYTSPAYAQTIIDTVAAEMNRIYNLFLSRNPDFNGGVALVGHSLGSLILFDLLAHQKLVSEEEGNNRSFEETTVVREGYVIGPRPDVEEDLEPNSLRDRSFSFAVGSASGTGQVCVTYPTLEFEPTAFFALGSPIGMFITVRGIDKLGDDFHFPTCPAFFNIFHPFDPVAYRIETLIDSNCDRRPVLIPHHKGRKRLHLELKETMQRVGATVKQKLLDSVTRTWNSLYQMATFTKQEDIEKEIDRVIEGELHTRNPDAGSTGSGEDVYLDFGLGRLNGGRRVDFVLQEAPHEVLNEYVFAFTSHAIYWQSEDTILMILREIYASKGIVLDKTAPSDPSFAPPLLSGYQQLPSVPTYQQPAQPVFQSPSPLSAYQVSNPFESSINGNVVSSPQPLLFLNPAGHASSVPLMPVASSQPSMPNSSMPKSSSAGNIAVIGGRPVMDPTTIATTVRGMDPTAPMLSATPIGPPPRSGFVPSK